LVGVALLFSSMRILIMARTDELRSQIEMFKSFVLSSSFDATQSKKSKVFWISQKRYFQNVLHVMNLSMFQYLVSAQSKQIFSTNRLKSWYFLLAICFDAFLLNLTLTRKLSFHTTLSYAIQISNKK
jgi:hypothetical protein